MGAKMSNEFDNFDDPDFDDESEVDQENVDELANKLGLTTEQYLKLIDDVENFNNSYLSYLAGTAKYEIVPTQLDDEHYLEEKHYKLVKKECAKVGAKILYSYSVGAKQTIVINPSNLKTIVIQEGEAH